MSIEQCPFYVRRFGRIFPREKHPKPRCEGSETRCVKDFTVRPKITTTSQLPFNTTLQHAPQSSIEIKDFSAHCPISAVSKESHQLHLFKRPWSTMPHALTIAKPPTVKAGMLIRRPPHDVFEALADPSITTQFWYTKSSGRMEQGASLVWEWEMYDHSTRVQVKEVEPDKRIIFSWDGYDVENPSTVEFLFVPHDGSTYLQVTEKGFTGDGETQVKRAMDSTGGFTFVISAAKALLEHGIVLGLVKDAFPAGLKLPESE